MNFSNKLSINYIVNNKTHKNIYVYGMYISYFLFFAAFTGVIAISPQYLSLLNDFIIYYISLFLIIRFNPWTSKYIKHTKENTEYERGIAYSAGIFLLLTTGAVKIAKKYTKNHIIDPVINTTNNIHLFSNE